MNLDELIQRCSASPDERWDLCSELHNSLLSGEVAPASLAPYAAEFASFWRDVDEHVRPFQRRTGNSWRWQEDYQDPRNEANLLLEILGDVPGELVFAALHSALTLLDPLLLMTAAVSLLRLGQTPSPEAMEAIAEHDETRARWERRLRELGFGYLFPPEFDEPEPHARALLVEWLIHPTEWECAPDDIELIDIVDGMHVFQFRTRPGYHESSVYGWVAGIVGNGSAFSDYEPAVLVDAAEHVRRMAPHLGE